MRGFFISFEGVEGCGKTTQAARLDAELQSRGLSVELVREPGGTEVGEAIRELLLHSDEQLSPWAEAFLFTAARAQLLKERVLPRLARGSVVIADRFADSTIAYQGAGRGLEIAVLGAMQAVLKVKPDLTLLLDLDPAEGFRRQESAGHDADRMEQEGLIFMERVRRGYLDFAGREPGRYVVIDAARDPDAVAAEVLRTVLDRTAAHGMPTAVSPTR